MIASDTKTTYQVLYNAWKEELLSKDLTSLDLNFIKKFKQQINGFTTENQDHEFINNLFIKRIEFLIQDLITLRKTKIFNSVLNKEQISTSYLSKQELLYYDYVQNSEKILENKSLVFSGQIKDYISQNSNLKEQTIGTNQPQPKVESKASIEVNPSPTDEISVIFLEDLEEFIYVNNHKYGPFKKNEIAQIPKDVFSKILLPKKIAQIKD